MNFFDKLHQEEQERKKEEEFLKDYNERMKKLEDGERNLIVKQALDAVTLAGEIGKVQTMKQDVLMRELKHAYDTDLKINNAIHQVEEKNWKNTFDVWQLIHASEKKTLLDQISWGKEMQIKLDQIKDATHKDEIQALQIGNHLQTLLIKIEGAYREIGYLLQVSDARKETKTIQAIAKIEEGKKEIQYISKEIKGAPTVQALMNYYDAMEAVLDFGNEVNLLKQQPPSQELTNAIAKLEELRKVESEKYRILRNNFPKRI